MASHPSKFEQAKERLIAMSKLEDDLSDIISDITYRPSEDQYKVKIAFWHRFNDSPFAGPGDVTLGVIQKFVSDYRLPKWWANAGFKEWFRNREEFRERVEHLAHKALTTLEQVLDSDDPKSANAKVGAAKLLMEVARKMPPKHIREIYVDDKIGKMTKVQLEDYIQRNLPSPVPVLLEERNEDS